MTDPVPTFSEPASAALPSVPLTETPAAIVQTPAAITTPAETTIVVPKKPEHLATQSVYPWRTAVRTGGAALVGFELAAAAASPVIGPFVDRYIPGAGATVIGFGVFCGALAALTNRIANLAPVSSFLTSIHLGPVPKH